MIPKEFRLTPMVENTALEHMHAAFQSFNVPTGWYNNPPIAMLAWVVFKILFPMNASLISLLHTHHIISTKTNDMQYSKIIHKR